jgi:hypothetical protein
MCKLTVQHVARSTCDFQELRWDVEDKDEVQRAIVPGASDCRLMGDVV